MNLDYQITLVLDSIGLFGTAVFAISGMLAAATRQMDWLGALILAAVTSIGGGTLRDILIGRPVFWLYDQRYLSIIVLTFATMVILRRRFQFPSRGLDIVDAIGLAVFTISGLRVSLEHNLNYGPAIILGTMTGVAGGIVRDILSGCRPLVLSEQVYATAAIAGAILYSLLAWLQLPIIINTMVSTGLIVLLRLTSIYCKWELPKYD